LNKKEREEYKKAIQEMKEINKTFLEKIQENTSKKTKKEKDLELIKSELIKQFPDIFEKLSFIKTHITGEIQKMKETIPGESKSSGEKSSNSSQGENTLETFKDEPYLIQGLCQGGKTSYIIALSLFCYLQCGKALVVLRNSDSDKKQFYTRIKNYVDEMFFRLNITEVSIPLIRNSDDTRDGIHLILGNDTSLECYTNWQPKTFTMFLDEADYLDTGKSERTKTIDILKDKSQGFFLVSATVLDCMAKDDIKPQNICYIPKHPNYRGIEQFDFYIKIDDDAKYVGKASGDFFESDKSLDPFCAYYNALPPMQSRTGDNFSPHMCLINYSHLKEPMYRALNTIRDRYPSIFVMVQTGDGITWSHRGSEPKKDTTSSLSDFLQKLKSKKMLNNIIIIAGDLASRGMSYVSSDYGWHLTHNRVLGPDSRILSEWIQAVCRLAGIFNDSHPLKLCLRKKDLDKILKAHYIQEELLLQISTYFDSPDKEQNCKDIIESRGIYKEKIPKLKYLTRVPYALKIKSLPTNTGMSMKVYEGKELPSDELFSLRNADVPSEKDKKEYAKKRVEEEKKCEEWESTYLPEDESDSEEENIDDDEEFERLKKIFKTWSTAKSKIGKFMQNLNPTKTYTKNEIEEMCKKFSITLNLLLNSKYVSGSNGYGKILEKKKDTFRLYPQLVTAFKKNFKKI